jgi:hypothetical protein
LLLTKYCNFSRNDELMAGFTFYGDLLGIGAAYQLSTQAAYEKLNRFYSIVFERLQGLCRHEGLKVNLFSDSVLIWGDNPVEILVPLEGVYRELFRHNALLRGAMVEDKLERDPRVEVKNLQKFLPTNDTLARAVGLEESTKGARLLISSKLGQDLLADVAPWRTVEGYISDAHAEIPVNSILRRICPSPEGKSYELLYFWSTDQVDEFNYTEGKASLREISKYLLPPQAIHYRQTIGVIERSEARERHTRRALRAQPSD